MEGMAIGRLKIATGRTTCQVKQIINSSTEDIMDIEGLGNTKFKKEAFPKRK